ncbi:MAG: hypothetical protein ORN58_03635, partial [Sediminibacterium sp.]|nr:hypothetical protein [Sediminibacterium sp.]
VILTLLVITIGFVGYYKSCNKTDMLSPIEITNTNNNKNEMADYSSQINQNRIILAQALIKAFNENSEMMNVTFTECNKFFDGDRNTLCVNLFKQNAIKQVNVNGKLVNSSNFNFGDVVNSYISTGSYVNSEGKSINSISNKTNFVEEVINTDPLIQVYFYNPSPHKLFDGIVVTPVYYNEHITKEFIVVKRDGTLDKIRGDKRPENDNYFVLSTNERTSETYKKLLANNNKLIKINIGGRERVCLSVIDKGIVNKTVLVSEPAYTYLKSNPISNSFNTNQKAYTYSNSSDKKIMVRYDEIGCIIDEPSEPLPPPPPPTYRSPLIPCKNFLQITAATFNSWDNLYAVEGFLKGQPEVYFTFHELIKNRINGRDTIYQGPDKTALVPSGWYRDYWDWGGYHKDLLWSDFIINSTNWCPDDVGYYRYISAAELDEGTLRVKEVGITIDTKSGSITPKLSFQYDDETEILFSFNSIFYNDGSKDNRSNNYYGAGVMKLTYTLREH